VATRTPCCTWPTLSLPANPEEEWQPWAPTVWDSVPAHPLTTCRSRRGVATRRSCRIGGTPHTSHYLPILKRGGNYVTMRVFLSLPAHPEEEWQGRGRLPLPADPEEERQEEEWQRGIRRLKTPKPLPNPTCQSEKEWQLRQQEPPGKTGRLPYPAHSWWVGGYRLLRRLNRTTTYRSGNTGLYQASTSATVGSSAATFALTPV